MANMFDENGNYNKTEWKPGDRITAGKLNKIEDALEAINNNDIERHKEADERLDALEEQNEAVEERFDELEDLVADNKSEVEVLIYENNVKMDRLEQEMNEGIDTVEAIAHTVDDKIAEADASMKVQVNQGKADMEAMVAEVEADLEGLHAKDDELSERLVYNEKQIDSINGIFNTNKTSMFDFIPYDYIVYDTFHRADSENIGSVENSNSMEYIKFVDGGTDKAFEIKDNKLVGVVGNDKKAILGVDCGYSDNIIIEAKIDEDIGIAFRVSDCNNFINASYQDDRVCVNKFIEGAPTELLKYYIQNGNRANKLTVELKGDTIDLYLDDVFIKSIEESFNKNKTIHGIYNRTNSTANLRFVEIFSIKKAKTNKNIQFNTLTSNIPFNAYLENAGYDHSIVTNQDGTTFTLRKTDNCARSELLIPYGQCNRYCEYSIDIKLEGDYEIDSNSSEIITQFHNYNIENKMNPVLALFTSNGNYFITRLWSEKRNPTAKDCEKESTMIGSYSDDVGKWVNWRYRINWGYTTLSKPFIEIYKNGILVYSRLFVPNCVNELYGVYFKCGIYKWDYVENPSITNINERVVSFRNLSILDN